MFVTPLLPYRNGDTTEIDEDGYRKFLRVFLTDENLEAGLAVIANPEAGEIFYLSREEKRRVVEITLEEVAGRAPVLAGALDVTTAGSVDVARDAAELGVDGLFVFPAIGAQDVAVAWDADKYPEVMTDMFQAIAAEVDLPMVVHPVATPSIRYGIGLSASATRYVCENVPNVVGWKMTYNYNGYREIARVLRSLDRHVDILGALAKFFHENLANEQFDGTSSGAWNYAPEPMMEHILAWRRGDVQRATEIWNGGLAQVHEYVFAEMSRLHIRYKTAAWLRGFIDNPLMRPPMPKPRREEIETIYSLLGALGVSRIERAEVDAFLDRLAAPVAVATS
jgi:dihydrodipicolinate synthase/N-acetylneuraminate lyase